MPHTTEAFIENMDRRIEEYLKKGNGKFAMETICWAIGYVSMGMFRKYLKQQVKLGKLKTEKDYIGIVWYSRV